MSGVIKAHVKVFKKLVVKPIQKVWEKRKEIAKLAVIAAATYFVVGTASAYFAAPKAGLGSAMSSTGSNMWSSTTSFFSGGEAAAADAAASSATSATAGSVTPMPQIAAQPLAPSVTPAMETAAYDASLSSVPAAAPQPGLIEGAMKGAGNFVTNNPIATMMIGSGLSNAAAAREARRAEEDARRSRGTMGFNYEGQSAYQPQQGLVSRQMNAPATAQQQQQRVRPIARSNLANINPQDIKRKV